jgi:hypothetical protein
MRMSSNECPSAASAPRAYSKANIVMLTNQETPRCTKGRETIPKEAKRRQKTLFHEALKDIYTSPPKKKIDVRYKFCPESGQLNQACELIADLTSSVNILD